MVKYILSGEGNIILVINGWQHHISKEHVYYEKILEMLENGEHPEKIMEFADIKGSLESFGIDPDVDRRTKEYMETGLSPGMAALRASFHDMELEDD